MGQIKKDVAQDHLRLHPDEYDLIKPFTNGFNISWARKRRSYGSNFSTYIIAPENKISTFFGIKQEVLLVYFDYSPLQARTMQAIDSLFQEHPYQGRVDPTIFIMIVKNKCVKDWVSNYISENPQSRMPVVFDISDIRIANNKPWEVINVMSNYLYFRDLFDFNLPINNDLFFFGRERQISELIALPRM